MKMYKWERTFSQWLLYLLAALMLTACGSGDGDSVLPVTGVSDYQLSVSSTATSIGASGSATVTATLLTPTGTPVAGATIAFTRTGSGALAASSATTNAAGVATVVLNGTAAVTGSGTVTASYSDPSSNIASRSLTYTVSTGDQVILFVDKSQVKTGVGDSVTVTAKVTDTNGAFVPNRVVTFTRVGTGDLQIVSAITDANGTATATYTPGSIDYSNRTVDVVATTTSGGTTSIEGRTTITVNGTRVTLSSNVGTNITLGTTPIVTATLLDGNGNPIPNAVLTFSSANNNAFTPSASGTTNAQGQATATVAVNTAAGSNETITVSSALLGASGSLAFAVTGTRFDS
jgi:adhesin/invasin